MSKSNFYKSTIRLDQTTYNQLNKIAQSRNKPLATVIRETIKKGLSVEWIDENVDTVSKIVRQQLDLTLKPHVNRLAKLSSKSGHMSATAAFLNVQAFMDLVPKEKRKDVIELYNNARKKAVEYMKTNTKDWENNF